VIQKEDVQEVKVASSYIKRVLKMSYPQISEKCWFCTYSVDL